MGVQAKMSILIAEDNKAWQKIYTEILTSEGYQVTLAVGYEEARRQLGTTSFELAIVDAQLDDPAETDLDISGDQISLRGLQLVQALRAQRPALKLSFQPDIKSG